AGNRVRKISGRTSSTRGNLGAAAIRHAVNGAGVIVRHQQRTVFHDLHVDGSADIGVVLQKAGEERLPRFNAAVLVQISNDDVAADFLGAVPGTVTRDESGIAVLGRKHLA